MLIFVAGNISCDKLSIKIIHRVLAWAVFLAVAQMPLSALADSDNDGMREQDTPTLPATQPAPRPTELDFSGSDGKQKLRELRRLQKADRKQNRRHNTLYSIDGKQARQPEIAKSLPAGIYLIDGHKIAIKY